MPEKKEIFTGLQSYVIFNRNLEHDSGKLRSTQEFLLLSYGVYDWLALDLKGGAGNIKKHSSGTGDIDYPTYLAGGYGFRVRLYQANNKKAVFGFQHISVHPKTVSAEGSKNKAVLDDWQFSLLGSYDFKKLTPYLGMRWSRIGYIHWKDKNRQLVKSDPARDIGVILGFDLPLSEKIWLNLEGSVADSEAAAFSINYAF
ncbi:MAG: hypothetical protein NTU54_01915 [Candidatus Omnitrophica bacterium]|nr:hypothetical protein [Candidatus Omnitrophota bacterium]